MQSSQDRDDDEFLMDRPISVQSEELIPGNDGNVDIEKEGRPQSSEEMEQQEEQEEEEEEEQADPRTMTMSALRGSLTSSMSALASGSKFLQEFDRIRTLREISDTVQLVSTSSFIYMDKYLRMAISLVRSELAGHHAFQCNQLLPTMVCGNPPKYSMEEVVETLEEHLIGQSTMHQRTIRYIMDRLFDNFMDQMISFLADYLRKLREEQEAMMTKCASLQSEHETMKNALKESESAQKKLQKDLDLKTRALDRREKEYAAERSAFLRDVSTLSSRVDIIASKKTATGSDFKELLNSSTALRGLGPSSSFSSSYDDDNDGRDAGNGDGKGPTVESLQAAVQAARQSQSALTAKFEEEKRKSEEMIERQRTEARNLRAALAEEQAKLSSERLDLFEKMQVIRVKLEETEKRLDEETRDLRQESVESRDRIRSLEENLMTSFSENMMLREQLQAANTFIQSLQDQQAMQLPPPRAEVHEVASSPMVPSQPPTPVPPSAPAAAAAAAHIVSLSFPSSNTPSIPDPNIISNVHRPHSARPDSASSVRSSSELFMPYHMPQPLTRMKSTSDKCIGTSDHWPSSSGTPPPLSPASSYRKGSGKSPKRSQSRHHHDQAFEDGMMFDNMTEDEMVRAAVERMRVIERLEARTQMSAAKKEQERVEVEELRREEMEKAMFFYSKVPNPAAEAARKAAAKVAATVKRRPPLVGGFSMVQHENQVPRLDMAAMQQSSSNGSGLSPRPPAGPNSIRTPRSVR